MSTFIVICQSVVGGPGRGYEISYDSDLLEFLTREAAVSHGFTVRDSDDFNIGVLDGARRLTAFCWMDEEVDHDLAKISEAIGLPA